MHILKRFYQLGCQMFGQPQKCLFRHIGDLIGIATAQTFQGALLWSSLVQRTKAARFILAIN